MPTLAPTAPMSSWSPNLYGCSPSHRPSALPQLHATRWSRPPFRERAIDEVVPAAEAEVASDAGTTVQEPAERRIAAGLATGDRQALADAFAEWGVMSHAFCVGRVGHNAADDLTQQVFVAAWRSRSSFDPDRLSMPLGTVKSHQRRGLRRLRDVLGGAA